MVPKAIELASRVVASAGFVGGVGAVYVFDLTVQRGRTAGVHAAQRSQIRHRVGAGGMFYLCVTELVPEAESRQYQQSSALAAAAGFVAIMLLAVR
jgi:zinc transporter ZupT